jgi:hypothetical protein
MELRDEPQSAVGKQRNIIVAGVLGTLIGVGVLAVLLYHFYLSQQVRHRDRRGRDRQLEHSHARYDHHQRRFHGPSPGLEELEMAPQG